MNNMLVSNAEILEMFKEIEEIQSDINITHSNKNKQIKQIKNDIVVKLSFLVYNQTSCYKRFENYEDLAQEGFVGLIRAVNKFDYTIYPNFFAYADQWIRHSVKRAASRFDIVYSPNKERVVYSEQEESIDVEDLDLNPENIFFVKEVQQEIYKTLLEFSGREIDIVNKVFGLSNNAPQALRKIGPQVGLTHERVRQIKNDVIGKLKQHKSIIDIMN